MKNSSIKTFTVTDLRHGDRIVRHQNFVGMVRENCGKLKWPYNVKIHHYETHIDPFTLQSFPPVIYDRVLCFNSTHIDQYYKIIRDGKMIWPKEQ